MRLFYYHLKVFIPLIVLFTSLHFKIITPLPFLAILFFYGLVYRTYIDAKKLVEQEVILKKDMWKLVIPFRRARYFKELYFTL